MNKNQVKELKEKLTQEKEKIEKEFKTFATEDKKIGGGDWSAKFPKFGGGDGGMEEEADEVQEYEKLLSVEHSLELKLRDINLALEKIGKDDGKEYGKCESCGKKIGMERLNVWPEAKFCVKCK